MKSSAALENCEAYRDELNFAEFPLASVSTSLPKGQKTLEFTDEIFDKARNQRITRKLTITAADKYGLPTAMDDEVILGLIQLTGRSGFADRRVFFTRYELLKLLNWTDDTRNYKRLEQSLNRWLGVTLYYDKSWWSKEEQCWVNEGFHILDHVQILDKERQRRASTRASKREGEPTGKSSFVWNEVVFNSFKAGYMKQIDFEFYKELESAVSKRMYRFLDKRFYHRARLEFDLRTFACEHIGLSKNYHNGELKRVLSPAIAELESRGFLKPLSPEERFVREGKAQWTIVFVRNTKTLPQELPELAEELVKRGINQTSAQSLTRATSEEKIREKLTFFDWLCEKKDPRVQRNPAGFLYRAISEDFTPPPDYQARVKPPAPRKPTAPVRPAPVEKPSPESIAERERLQAYWASLPPEEQERIEHELVRAAPVFLREQYMAGRKERGLLFQTIRQGLIENYVRSVLKEA
jgi:plasmid replication initiation protein